MSGTGESGVVHVTAEEHERFCRNGGCPGYEFHSVMKASDRPQVGQAVSLRAGLRAVKDEVA